MTQPERLSLAWRYVIEHPGCSGTRLAREAGYKANNGTAILTALEYNGYLLSEDERGRLYPWDDRHEP